MKPLHNYASHKTYDLTEAKVHVVTAADGSRRLVAFIPKTWERITEERIPMRTHNPDAEQVDVHAYIVTAWDQVELAKLP